VDKISAPGGGIPAWTNYSDVKKTVIRQLMFACPHIWNATDWDAIGRRDLQAWSPDETKVLAHFPDTATAEYISLFMFGRPDWGLLAPLWCSLWKPAWPVLTKAGFGLAGVKPAAICQAASALHGETGSESSPADAVRRWLAQEPRRD
jgi:hypothetical protein